MPSGSSVGECSNFDRIHEQDAEEEDSQDELSIENIKRFHKKDRDLLESSDEDNHDIGDYLGRRRTREHRKQENVVSAGDSKTISSSELTGTEILNRRSRKDRMAER